MDDRIHDIETHEPTPDQHDRIRRPRLTVIERQLLTMRADLDRALEQLRYLDQAAASDRDAIRAEIDELRRKIVPPDDTPDDETLARTFFEASGLSGQLIGRPWEVCNLAGTEGPGWAKFDERTNKIRKNQAEGFAAGVRAVRTALGFATPPREPVVTDTDVRQLVIAALKVLDARGTDFLILLDKAVAPFVGHRLPSHDPRRREAIEAALAEWEDIDK